MPSTPTPASPLPMIVQMVPALGVHAVGPTGVTGVSLVMPQVLARASSSVSTAAQGSVVQLAATTARPSRVMGDSARIVRSTEIIARPGARGR